ncbi:response regulator transcription factor [Novosphingobium olei]|nr:helix-turn-helix transcriptional regulator [Novosphingobium olei]
MQGSERHGIDFYAMHTLNDALHRLEEVRLTARQEDCIALVAKGMSSKEIGRELGISPSTVDNHIAIAMHQFGFQNRGAVARWYRETVESQRNQVKPEPPPSAMRIVGRSIPTGGIRNSLSLKERILSVAQVSILSIMATSAIITFVLGLIFVLKLHI